MDPVALLATLHGHALRVLCEGLDAHFAGLVAAARAAHRVRRISNKTQRTLTHLDIAYAHCRHITTPVAHSFLGSLTDEVSRSADYHKGGHDRAQSCDYQKYGHVGTQGCDYQEYAHVGTQGDDYQKYAHIGTQGDDYQENAHVGTQGDDYQKHARVGTQGDDYQKYGCVGTQGDDYQKGDPPNDRKELFGTEGDDYRKHERRGGGDQCRDV